MKITLATFMKIAITVVVIAVLIFGKLYASLDDIVDKVMTYITSTT